MLTVPMSPFRERLAFTPNQRGKGRQFFLEKKIDEGIVYLPKIFFHASASQCCTILFP